MNINDVMEKIINNFDDIKKGNSDFLTFEEKEAILKSMLQLSSLQNLVNETNTKIKNLLNSTTSPKDEEFIEVFDAMKRIDLQKKDYQSFGVMPKDELIHKLKKLDQDYSKKQDKIEILNKLFDILKQD